MRDLRPVPGDWSCRAEICGGKRGPGATVPAPDPAVWSARGTGPERRPAAGASREHTLRCASVGAQCPDRQIYETRPFEVARSWGLTALSEWNPCRVDGNILKVDRDDGCTTTL